MAVARGLVTAFGSMEVAAAGMAAAPMSIRAGAAAVRRSANGRGPLSDLGYAWFPAGAPKLQVPAIQMSCGGHSLAMLYRIAAAVERRVDIRFLPRKRRLQPARE